MPENMLFSEADKPHILVVDDDDRILNLLSRYLRKTDLSVATAKDASDAEMVMKLAFLML